MMRKLFAFLLMVWLMLMLAPALAQHECQGGHNCNDAGGDIQVLTELAGDDFRALSLSQALGDVDIAGCIVTTQWGIIVFQRQGFVYDVFCLARELDMVKKYNDAAAMRCLHKIPADLYGSRCLAVMNYQPPEGNNPPPPPPQGLTRSLEEEERDDRLTAIEQRLDQDAAARRAYARQAATDKRVEEQRARDAFNAYKAAQQMEVAQQQEEPPNE